MNIIKNLLDKSKYQLKCPNAMTPEYIIIHNTANNASARNEVSYMIRNDSPTGFHFAVDDKEIVQGIPLNRNSFNCGNAEGNRKGISIEICYSKSGGEKFDKAEQNAAKLIQWLLEKYGWDKSRVTTHKKWSGKNCPHRTLQKGWERFLDMIDTNTPFLVKVTSEALNFRSGAGIQYKVNGTVKKGEVFTIVEVKDGWGKLKSGAGWINLKYTKKVS